MACMLRHKQTGAVTPATPAMRKDDAYELVEAEPHQLLYRVDAAGGRFDRFGNSLDGDKTVSLKPRKKAAKPVPEAAAVDVDDLLAGID